MGKQRWDHALTYLLRRTVGGQLNSLVYVADWSRPAIQRIIGKPPADEHAFTSPQLVSLLADHLRSDGFWHGNGYACAIDPRGLMHRQRVGTGLHEAAHWLCWRNGHAEQHGENWQAACRKLQRRCPVAVTLQDIDAGIQW